MNAADFDRFGQLLGDVMGFYGKDVSQFAADVWWNALKPFDLAAVADAFNRHCVDADRGQFPPKPADVVRLIQGGSKDGAAMAWAKLDKALRCVGTYQSVVFDDPIIHACVADLGGWTSLGRLTETEWGHLARRFETLYQGYRLRGELPAYPPVLIGISQADNEQRGYKTEKPALLGNPQIALQVMNGGRAGGMLQITEFARLALDRIAQ